jgi:hypothetical protein
MFVQVDTTQMPPVVTLEEPDDTKQFQLTVVGGSAADHGLVYGALVDAAAGRLDGEHAWIAVDAVRRMAAGRTGPGWDVDFEAMLEYASGKGWIDETGATIRAHVEWKSGFSAR